MDETEKLLLNNAVADAIRGARSIAGLSQKELSEASGVGYETLKNIESGVHRISVLQVAQIASATNKTPTWLVDEAMARYEVLRNQSGDA